MTIQIKTEEINYLIYKYLLEAGEYDIRNKKGSSMQHLLYFTTHNFRKNLIYMNIL